MSYQTISRTKFLTLPVKLTSAEVYERERGVTVAAGQQTDMLGELEDAKVVVSDIKKNIDESIVAQRRMAAEALSREQLRSIECECIVDFDSGSLVVVRKDTHEPVAEEVLRDDDRQLYLRETFADVDPKTVVNIREWLEDRARKRSLGLLEDEPETDDEAEPQTVPIAGEEGVKVGDQVGDDELNATVTAVGEVEGEEKAAGDDEELEWASPIVWDQAAVGMPARVAYDPDVDEKEGVKRSVGTIESMHTDPSKPWVTIAYDDNRVADMHTELTAFELGWPPIRQAPEGLWDQDETVGDDPAMTWRTPTRWAQVIHGQRARLTSAPTKVGTISIDEDRYFLEVPEYEARRIHGLQEIEMGSPEADTS